MLKIIPDFVKNIYIGNGGNGNFSDSRKLFGRPGYISFNLQYSFLFYYKLVKVTKK